MQMLFRKSTLQNISHDIGDIAVRLANAGSDRLYVKKRRNHHEFYRYDPVAQKETYISKRDFDTISELAQNAYYRELIPHLQHIAGLMKNEEFDLLKKIPMDVYDNQHPVLKNYIRPYYAKCLDEIGTWLRNPGDPRHMLGFKQDDPVIFTEDGVMVRSKTEKFYGDFCCNEGTPYLYEKPLFLEKIKQWVLPDFTFFDPRRGCEVIFEHFGMMGNAGYTKDALKKIECYKREGLTDSGRFFYTMESDGNCDNIKHFQEIARRFSIKNQLVKGCFRAAFFACDGKMQSCPPKLVEILQSTAMLHR